MFRICSEEESHIQRIWKESNYWRTYTYVVKCFVIELNLLLKSDMILSAFFRAMRNFQQIQVDEIEWGKIVSKTE